MGVEPFDLDAAGDSPQLTTPGPPTPQRRPATGPRRTAGTTGTLVALMVLSAAASAVVTDVHVRSAAAAAQRVRNRAVARLVVTDGSFLAGRTQDVPAGDVRLGEALVSLQVVNAGPVALTMLSVHGDGDASGLRDVLGDGQPLPPASAMRIALIGSLNCPTTRSVTVRTITVRLRSADGHDHAVRAGPEAVAAWVNGLARACSQTITTP